MRFVTMALALLTVCSGVAGIWLVTQGHDRVVAVAIGWLGAGVALAGLGEAARCQLADRASAQPDRTWSWAALTSGLVPVACMIVLQATVLLAGRNEARSWSLWLLCYGAGTGGWTLYAAYASLPFSTLCRAQAFVGHLTFLSMSLALQGGLYAVMGVTMLVPLVIPPVIVGTLAARGRHHSFLQPSV